MRLLLSGSGSRVSAGNNENRGRYQGNPPPPIISSKTRFRSLLLLQNLMRRQSSGEKRIHVSEPPATLGCICRCAQAARVGSRCGESLREIVCPLRVKKNAIFKAPCPPC